MVRCIIAGSRTFNDYEMLCEAVEAGIKELGIKITEVISGNANGADKLGERWAEENGINVVTFPAEWNNLKEPGAVIKSRYNQWKKCDEEYNANAGFYRNEQMAKRAGKTGALIAIDFDTNGTNNMIKLAKEYGLKVYQHKPQPMQVTDFTYKF